MSNEEKRWHWRCQCGQESPSYMVRCPRCKAVLNISAAAVVDTPEPEIPVKPPVVGAEDWEPKKNPEPQKPKEKVKKEKKEKPRRSAGLTAVLLLLILLILLLGAVLVLLLKGGVPGIVLPTQPPVMQTDPVNTTPPPSTDPSTQPSDPAPTQPVVTAPPATTLPPATTPPTTQPPETQPPTTEPPETQPAFGSNMLKATIFDEEVIFKLSSARINNSEISVTYYAYNPRGEKRYYLSFRFDKNFTAGSYNTTGNILYTDVTITFAHANANGQYYRSYRENGGKSLVTGTFTIEKMSDDWMTYDGSFNVELVLYGEKDAVVINDAVFNFTLEKQ